jgi:hypothetical protein
MRMSSTIRLAVVTVVAAFALPAPAATSSIEIGSAAPALELVAADGSQRSLAASDGPKVLIFYRGLW